MQQQTICINYRPEDLVVGVLQSQQVLGIEVHAKYVITEILGLEYTGDNFEDHITIQLPPGLYLGEGIVIDGIEFIATEHKCGVPCYIF